MPDPKLNAEELAWLRKFERALSGRGSKELYDELGFSDASRLELYKARYAKRELEASRAGTQTLSLKEERTGGTNPMDAMIELIDRKARAKRR